MAFSVCSFSRSIVSSRSIRIVPSFTTLELSITGKQSLVWIYHIPLYGCTTFCCMDVTMFHCMDVPHSVYGCTTFRVRMCHIQLYGCHHILLIHPSVDGHFSFSFEAILNNMLPGTSVHEILHGCVFSFLLMTYVEVEFQDHLVSLWCFKKLPVFQSGCIISTCMRILSCFLSLVSLTPFGNQIF